MNSELQLLPALGAPALVAVFVLLVYSGRLVPRRTHDDVVHDRDEWRASHRISESARIKQAEQIDELLSTLETVNAVMKSVQKKVNQ